MFDSHGEFIVSYQDNIIEVEATGPFNLKAVKRYEEDVVEAVTHIHSPWGQIVFMHQNCLYTPEAEKEMHKFSKLRKRLGLSAIVLVFIDHQAMFLIKDKISEFYLQHDIPCEFFTQKVEASEWLSQQLQHISIPIHTSSAHVANSTGHTLSR